MSVRIAGNDVVFLNTYDVINEAFVKQNDIFSGRPTIRLWYQVLGDNGRVFEKFGDKFVNQKKFALHTLKRFGMGNSTMEDIINEEMEYFSEHLRSRAGKPINLTLPYYRLLGNITTKLVLGKRYDYNVSSKVKVAIESLQKQYTSGEAHLILLVYFHQFLSRIPPFRKVNDDFIEAESNIADALQDVIDERKKIFDPEHINDFLDAFLYEQKFGKEKKYFQDRQLQVTVRDLFIAGIETTSTTVSWCCLAILNYPKYHEKILKEIADEIGSNFPSMANRPNMPITCAFVQEVSRFCTLVPNALEHLTTEDTKLFHYNIPKGTRVAPNIYVAHFDEETWPDPFNFNPARHLDRNGKFVHSPKVIQFSLDGRSCLGEALARMEVFLIFVGMLQRFKFSATSGTLPTIKEGLMGIDYCPKPYEVLLETR
ncbi:unnamed protein product [Clavelina lepadiformis]|uniref:Cytochrome P450 n=1 Tax=Clavelina lepadiformis TaxID=159417 RepID=A0ABP0G592_CLALP